MKLFGSLKELVSAVFRKDSQEITLRPNQSTTYTANRDMQLPPGDSSQVLVSATSSQTFTNKTVDGDDNTVQDLPITALKTVVGDANKVLRRDGSGVPQSGNTIPNTSALVTTDATQTLTGKTLDGDDNTVQDLPITSLKTVLGDANKVLRRDASGVPQSGNSIPNSSALVTTDASQTITGKTIDGDDNTVQDLPETAIKTNLTNASKFFTRDASGVPESATKAVPSGVVVGTTDTQTLSNKTLTTPSMSGPTITDYAELDHQSSDPSAPAGSGDIRVYGKSGKLYTIDNNGTVTQVGSGSGEVNLIDNSDFEATANGVRPTGWAVSGAQIDILSTTTTPLRGTRSANIAATSSVTTSDYVEYAFTLPREYLGRVMRLSFYHEAGSGYDASDANVVIRDVTNSTNITPSISNIPGGTGKFEVTWIPSSSTSYAVRFRSGVASSAWALKIDDLTVNDQKVLVGMAGSDWQSFTPTGNWSTNTTWTGQWRRVGDAMEVQFKAALGGAPNSAAFTVNLPSGYTIDTAKLIHTGTGVNGTPLGWGNANNAAVATYPIAMMYQSSSSVVGVVQNASGASFLFYGQNTTQSIPNTFQSGDAVYGSFIVPISQWSSNIQLAERQLEEYAFNTDLGDADDTTSFGYGPLGTPFPSSALSGNRQKRVRFQTPILPTDVIVMEIQTAAGAPWVELKGAGAINDNGPVGLNWHGTMYGAGVLPESTINTTDIDVMLARYQYNGGTYAGAGGNWDSSSGAMRWRLKKVAAGGVVGFPVGTKNIIGRTDGTSVSSGYIGETVTGSQATTTISHNTATDILSIQLTAGKWIIDAGVWGYNGSGTAGYIEGSISTTSASLGGGSFPARNDTVLGNATSSHGTMLYREVNITSTTTYYLVGLVNASPGTNNIRGWMKATRVA